jgi:hypothetical protein
VAVVGNGAIQTAWSPEASTIALMTIYELVLKLLSLFGYRPAPRPDLERHQRVVKNLERAVRLTQESFPKGSTPSTGNFAEDMVSGDYQEPHPS